ncbi:MAG: shikimate kinase [Jatrophihabitans sp.]
MTPRVVLIGMPGAGKTTVGRRVAKRLGAEFLDVDDAIEARYRRTVGQLFADEGEPAFRVKEAATACDALREFGGVLALGGGALLHESTRERLRLAAEAGTHVVLLTASLRSLTSRVGTGATRPLLAGNVQARLTELTAQRGELFAPLATCVVDTDGINRGKVVSRVVEAVSVGSGS